MVYFSKPCISEMKSLTLTTNGTFGRFVVRHRRELLASLAVHLNVEVESFLALPPIQQVNELHRSPYIRRMYSSLVVRQAGYDSGEIVQDLWHREPDTIGFYKISQINCLYAEDGLLVRGVLVGSQALEPDLSHFGAERHLGQIERYVSLRTGLIVGPQFIQSLQEDILSAGG